MRVALCLHGLSGGYNSKGRKIRGVDGYKCFKEFLLDRVVGSDVSIDVFMHSWTVSEKDRMLACYRPKRAIFEKQIVFAGVPLGFDDCGFDPVYYQNMQSMCYSYAKVNSLKCLEEHDGGFKYDLVIHSRFDLWIGSWGVDLKDLCGDQLYFLKYHRGKLLDHLWIGSSSTMDAFCLVWERLGLFLSELKKMGSKAQYMNHDLIYVHLVKLGLLGRLKSLGGLVEAGTFAQK